MKGLLKREQLVRGLDALLKFPGIIAGLQLGNVHKHLALHIDENISQYFYHTLRVWEFITDDDHRINAAVDIETVQCLQFRAPVTSFGDRVAIHRMFDQGILFEGLNHDLREQVRERVLSIQVIIPSIETFHENMKFISIGARILRKYIIDTSIPFQLESNRNKLSLFESLASCWSAEARMVEVEDGKTAISPGVPSVWLAYKTLFVAALRGFAQLSSDHPRQDVRGETMPAVAEAIRIASLSQLAQEVGFTNSKTTDNLTSPRGHPALQQYVPCSGRAPDWRAGIPFTKSYCQVRLQAFHRVLSDPVLQGDKVSPLFVFRDIINAFFEKNVDVKYQGHIDLPSPDSRASNTLESEVNSELIQDTEMEDSDRNQPAEISAAQLARPPIPNKLKAKSRRIKKHNKRRTGSHVPSVPTASDELMYDQASSEVLSSDQRDEAGIPETSIERRALRDIAPYRLENELPHGEQINTAESQEYTIERQDYRDPRPLHDLEISPNELQLETRGASGHVQDETSLHDQTITRLNRRSPASVSLEVNNLVEINPIDEAAIQLESQADLFDDLESVSEPDDQQIPRERDQRTPPPIDGAREELTDEQANIIPTAASARHTRDAGEPETLPSRVSGEPRQEQETVGSARDTPDVREPEMPPSRASGEPRQEQETIRSARDTPDVREPEMPPSRASGEPRQEQETIRSARYTPDSEEPETLPLRATERVGRPKRTNPPSLQLEAVAGKKRKRETTNSIDTTSSVSVPPIRGMQPQAPRKRKAPKI
ncbi:hypothetical protein FGRA07_11692 [Fusarium graminearum]|nr:hypothetical protein FGRA07_11692 [Fusarium graminearum]